MTADVAFVGPARGMAPAQARGVRRVLNGWRDTSDRLHHCGDLTGVEGASVAAELGYWVTAHPLTGPRVLEHHVNDDVEDPRPADARDAALLHRCGRVVAAVPGPRYWPTVPVWTFLARAHAARCELAIVGMNGALIADVDWPAGGDRR